MAQASCFHVEQSQKCFYCLRTNHQVGYLLALDAWPGLACLGFQLAQKLEKYHDIKHFLLGPPKKVKVLLKESS